MIYERESFRDHLKTDAIVITAASDDNTAPPPKKNVHLEIEYNRIEIC